MVKFPFELHIIAFLLFFAVQQAKSQDVVPEGKDVISADSVAVINLSSDSTIVSTDSINNRNALDAPVNMTAKDSMVMVMDGGNFLYLYGSGTIDYKDIHLDAENIEMDADKSEIHARFGVDSTGVKFGFPIIKIGEQQEIETEKLRYNFDTKKMFTNNVITQQGDGYIKAEVAKRMPDESFHMHNGKYTTCDDPECPHFYFVLTKAKTRPGKSTVTGPIYLNVEGVPLPIGLPFAYLPASSDYSSGLLTPSYSDELTRGFSLKDFGYYFAFNNHVDLELRGEIFTKGSWSISANSKYRKIYKYSGDIQASYLVTKIGDSDTKNLPNSDYNVSRDIKFNWKHQQDPKANPYGIFSANFQFSTSSYNRNNFGSTTLSQMTENTKASSISYNYRSPSPTLPISINTSASVNQRSRDSTISVSVPDMTISLSNIYPFKRKEQVGSDRWYEKIYMSYTSTIRNSINNVKENEFLNKNFFNDWKNGIKHNIPVSASFNFLKHINISIGFNYNENWYFNRSDYTYDYDLRRIVQLDTIMNGFYRTFQYDASVGLNTKFYGSYKFLPALSKTLGKWVEKTEIRHVMTPSISFIGAPDFSNPDWGMYKEIKYIDNPYTHNVKSERVPLYQNHLFQGPSSGKTGAISISLANNLEAKVPIAGTDSTRKITLIDNFGLSTSYNFLRDSLNWSDINASLRLKVFKTNINFSTSFEAYEYDENARHINRLRWKTGKGFWRLGRFTGTSTSTRYSINNDTFNKLFKRGNKDGDTNNNSQDSEGDIDNLSENRSSRPSLSSTKKKEGDYDSDGYLLSNILWELSFDYSIGVSYDRQNFDKVNREYPYKLNQNFGFNGRLSPTKSWDISFSGSYDFETKSVVHMHCSLSRKMHCWQMTASLVPIGPLKNYSFTIAINSPLLQDFKYQQSSNYRDALNWGR